MENKIKTGILGLWQDRHILEIIEQMDCFDITAVADTDIETAQNISKKFHPCQGYDDYRQMVAQNDLKLLIVSEPVFNAVEHIRAAIKKDFNIFKTAPAGRNFSEVAELASLARSKKIVFAIGNHWRYSGSWSTLKDYISQNRLESPGFIQAQWFLPQQIDAKQAWLKDPKLAGGGVLLYDAYQGFDMIVANFGLPEQVYALSLSSAPDRQQRTYLTEDTATIFMRYSESLIVNFSVSRSYGPREKNIKIYGKNFNIETTDNVFKTFDNSGNIIEEFEFFDEKQALLTQYFADLAEVLSKGENIDRLSQLRDNLAVAAVIEACYLSAKTLMPEEPAKILEMAGQKLN